MQGGLGCFVPSEDHQDAKRQKNPVLLFDCNGDVLQNAEKQGMGSSQSHRNLLLPTFGTKPTPQKNLSSGNLKTHFHHKFGASEATAQCAQSNLSDQVD